MNSSRNRTTRTPTSSGPSSSTNCQYRPIPDGKALNPLFFAEQIEKLNLLQQQKLAEANITLVTRFVEPFKLLAEQLKDPHKRKMAPVLDSIREFAHIVPSLDLSGNSELLGVGAAR